MPRVVIHHVIGREDNVVRVDFRREPDPPAPKFPGAAGQRRMTEDHEPFPHYRGLEIANPPSKSLIAAHHAAPGALAGPER